MVTIHIHVNTSMHLHGPGLRALVSFRNVPSSGGLLVIFSSCFCCISTVNAWMFDRICRRSPFDMYFVMPSEVVSKMPWGPSSSVSDSVSAVSSSLVWAWFDSSSELSSLSSARSPDSPLCSLSDSSEFPSGERVSSSVSELSS